MTWVALIIGSVTGGLARYAVAGFVYQRLGTALPYGTFLVNMSGCFLIGWFTSFAEAKWLMDPAAKLLLITGFCGAYTTFSSLIFETAELLKMGHWPFALLNMGGSLAVGLVCFLAGDLLGRQT